MKDTTAEALATLWALGKKRLKELGDLADALFAHIRPADLFTLLFPPALGLDLVRGRRQGRHRVDAPFDPDDRDPRLVDAMLAMARWWQRYYFETRITGTDRVPPDTHVLFVGNHNGGLIPIDALFAMNGLRDAGRTTAVYPLVHDFAYMAPKVARMAARAGVVRASPQNALAALHHGDVLVYPGGDRDAFRPFSQRDRVVFSGRKGFVRIAMQAAVPIVPLASVGLHESFFVLTQGRRVADALGLKRWLRTEVFPVALSLPWGIAPGFFPHLPLPTQIDMEFLDPVWVEGDPNDETLVQQYYDRVVDQLQAAVSALHAHRVPVVGRVDGDE